MQLGHLLLAAGCLVGQGCQPTPSKNAAEPGIFAQVTALPIALPDRVSYSVTLCNGYDHSVELLGVETSCTCTNVNPERSQLPAGASLELSCDVVGDTGPQDIRLIFADVQPSKLTLTLTRDLPSASDGDHVSDP